MSQTVSMIRLGLRTLAVFAASAVLVLAQSSPKTSPDQGNFINCLKGLPGCDFGVLSADQLKQVAEASRKRNVDYCLQESRQCDPTRLNSTEAAAQKAAQYRRNLDRCLGGSATCDVLLVDPKDL